MKTALGFVTNNKQISIAAGAAGAVLIGDNFFNEVAAAGLGSGDLTQAKVTTLAAAATFLATYALPAIGSKLKDIANRESADEAKARLLTNKPYLDREEAQFLWDKMLDEAKNFEGGLFD